MQRPKLIAAVAASTLCIGAGAGAVVTAAVQSDGPVVRQVAVSGAQPAASSTTLSVGQVYQRASKGVVEITVTSTDSGQNGFGGPQAQQALGSGFVYDTSGHIVTNDHVVDGASSITVRFTNGKTYKATLVGADASDDLAVIKVDAPASQLSPLALGDSSKVAVGDGVVAIGSPFGLENTVTSGIVSALHREMTSPNNFTIDDSIQTDAAINHGNSGGPLLNMQGKVIGINAQIESDSGGNDGVGFAVPSGTARKIANRLISTGKAEHAYLGVQLAAASNGAKVTDVVAGKAAANGGIKKDDVITNFAGKKVSSVDALRFAVDAKHPGDVVSVTLLRDGQSRTVGVTLSTRPNNP